MIMHQECIDYTKHYPVPFGTFVQASQENNPTSTPQPHTLDCIYLHFLSNQQCGHKLLHLGTGRVITCRTIFPIPLTQTAIDLVHAMANHDKMPSGF